MVLGSVTTGVRQKALCGIEATNTMVVRRLSRGGHSRPMEHPVIGTGFNIGASIELVGALLTKGATAVGLRGYGLA